MVLTGAWLPPPPPPPLQQLARVYTRRRHGCVTSRRHTDARNSLDGRYVRARLALIQSPKRSGNVRTHVRMHWKLKVHTDVQPLARAFTPSLGLACRPRRSLACNSNTHTHHTHTHMNFALSAFAQVEINLEIFAQTQTMV